MALLHVTIQHATPLIAAGPAGMLGHDTGVVEPGPPCLHPDDAKPVVLADLDSALALLAEPASRPTGRPQDPSRRVLVVTPHCGETDVQAALAAGAAGYILETCSRDELLAAIACIRRGSRYLSPPIAAAIADGFGRSPLTDREREVLGLLAEGLCNKRIATRLGISVGTVKAHMRQVLEKLGARSRTEAVVHAARRGLLRTARPRGPVNDALQGRVAPAASRVEADCRPVA